MKNLIFIIPFLVTFSAVAQPVLIKEVNNVINLAPYCFYLEDAEGKLSINDVRNKGAVFQKLKTPIINFGVTNSVFWIRCSIDNQTDEKLILELANTLITNVQLYEFDTAGLRAKYYSGSLVPFHQRQIKEVNFQFELTAAPHSAETIFLRVQHFRGTQFPLSVGGRQAFFHKTNSHVLFEGIYYGIMLVMVLYNLIVYFLLKDNSYLFYVLYVFFMGLYNAIMSGYVFKYVWPSIPELNLYADITGCFVGMASILFAINFLHTRQNAAFFHRLLKLMLAAYIINIAIILTGNFLIGIIALELTTLVVIVCLFITAYTVVRAGYQPARYFLIAWTLLLISVAVFILKDYNIFPYNSLTRHSMQIGSAVEAILLSIALANRINVLEKEKKEANLQALKSLEENKKLITEQNIVLEMRVGERTQELKHANKDLLHAIQNLKETQNQLVQREKMASFGELTAGIAHEIKNPLNFVNNFSEVSVELIEEMEKELRENRKDEAIGIVADIKANLNKITYHGKRADAIVKGMLQHSRSSSGEKEHTNINELTDEYFRLCYHGLRVKDKTFNVIINTDLDKSLPEINIVPQDIGRVLLNLFTNAFYAVIEKKKNLGGEEVYEPTVTVTTKRLDFPSGEEGISISVKDNGPGIPQKLLDKIFQPFFTTKPTGQGTGLGLSLSYDIIKAHGGEIKVETKEGAGAEFVIQLPLK